MEPVYHSVLDPMVALGYAAARTSRIRLGVAVLNLPFVSPAELAKQAATLDVLSGGRLDLGLGIGWMPEEFTATGASMARRGARAEEYVAALRALWADEVSSFSGEFYTIPAGRRTPSRCSSPGRRSCSAACPGRRWSGPGGSRTAGSPPAAPTCPGSARRSACRAAAAAAGRDPDAVRIVCRGVVLAGAEATGPDGGRLLLSGCYEQIREDAAWLAGQGVTELFYDLNWDPQIGTPRSRRGRGRAGRRDPRRARARQEPSRPAGPDGGQRPGGSLTRPSRCAMAAASVRLAAPSLARMFDT